MARDSVSKETERKWKEPEKGPSTLSQVSRAAGASKATPGGHPDLEQTGRACWLALKIEGFFFKKKNLKHSVVLKIICIEITLNVFYILGRNYKGRTNIETLNH